MRSSKAAFDLIVAEEVSSEKAYSKKYRRPEWPGASSGATIGIGYDLGQTAKATVISDWKGRVSADMLDAMVSACGHTGAAGKTATARVRSKIDIPWDVALEVHEERVVPRWEAKVAQALPNTDKLSQDCFGALLSLTFNRGPSFGMAGDRYREMRAIKAHMAAENFDEIPGEFRAMKRLWPSVSLAGLRRRRDTEARLFEKGLKAEVPVVKSAAPVTPIAEGMQGDPDLWSVQSRLKTMMYNPGGLDGLWGGLSAGAIAGFVNDRKSSIKPPASIEEFRKVLDSLKTEISLAEAARFTRPIAPERAEATSATLAPKLPEVQASVTAERAGFWGSIAVATSTVVTGVMKSAGDAIELLNPVKAFVGDVPWQIWGVGGLVGAVALYMISRKSGEAKNASVEAFREGARA